MVDFELLERDGLARLGRFTTPHGVVETPALLPVLHPDPARHPIPASELRREYGIQAVITSSYLTWRSPPLRAVAERDGIHRLLGFDGPVMTDSGAFQQHAYGSVEVGDEEILDFQSTIGSDIATVLDLFTEPEATAEQAEAALAVTEARSRSARVRRAGLLAIPVQGGLHADLRLRSARSASEGADVLAIGGVVPLLERYRFAALARAVLAARPGLAAATPVHLFGAGHPMVFGFAAALGIDLFDSSAYHKFARRGDLLFPDGTVPIEGVRETICRCRLCAEHPLSEVARWPPLEREARIARHNLAVSVEEVGRVRQAIRDGTLWELVERRSTGHPALRAGLREVYRHPEEFWATEPESRRTFREVLPESADRPVGLRLRRNIALLTSSRPPGPIAPRIPLRPEFLGVLPTENRVGQPIWWSAPSPFGPVPLELCDLYPVGPYLGVEEFTEGQAPRSRAGLRDQIGRGPPLGADLERDWTEEWTRRQVRTLLEWRYGRPTSDALAPQLRGERSRRTGRLRILSAGDHPAFVIGTDGVPRPTFRGASLLAGAIAAGRERVVVADDAVEFVRAGRSLFAKFVVAADPALVPAASAILVDERDELLAVGRLLLAPHEMPRFVRGVAVRVTAHARRPAPEFDESDAEVEPFPGRPEPLMGDPGPSRPSDHLDELR